MIHNDHGRGNALRWLSSDTSFPKLLQPLRKNGRFAHCIGVPYRGETIVHTRKTAVRPSAGAKVIPAAAAFGPPLGR